MYLDVYNVPATFVLSDSCRKGGSMKQQPAEADVTLPHLGDICYCLAICPSL